MLGAPPAFVLSQDQTLYKWYLITYKVLNRCNHSDTIACVLYELLVNLELIYVGFQTHDQGSTSFSFVQFSRSCCAVCSRWQLVYYISEPLDCQEVFWKFFEEVFFKKRAQAVVEGLAAASAAGQLDYYSKWSYFCQWGFSVFLTNFDGDFWARCMLGIGWAVRPICRGGCLHPPGWTVWWVIALGAREGWIPPLRF